MTVQADIEKEIPNKNKTIEKLLKINNLYQINIRIETDFFSILFNVVLLTLNSKECKWWNENISLLPLPIRKSFILYSLSYCSKQENTFLEYQINSFLIERKKDLRFDYVCYFLGYKTDF